MAEKSCYILGVKLNRVTLRQAVKKIERFISGPNAQHVAVANVYSTVLMQKDPYFKRINNNSSLVVADGMPLIWFSYLFKKPLPQRVSGPDLLEELATVAQKKNYSFFFLGSTEQTLKRLKKNLLGRFPFLKISGQYSPPFKDKLTREDNNKIINIINSHKPDILWVGMSAPKQEKWIHDNLDKIDCKVAIGIGAAFDFFSGNIKRAPGFMQQMGLEWLWRAFREPKRLWKRYLQGNSVFLWLVSKELINKYVNKFGTS